MRTLLRFRVGDYVQRKIAGRAQRLDRRDHPLRSKRNAELLGEHVGYFDFKAWRRVVAAGEGQRVGGQAGADHAGRLDLFERARGSRGRDGQRQQ